MKYKLLAADVDGTLVNDKSVFTPRTLTAIRDAVDAGVIFAVATGRPMCAAQELTSLTSKDMPIIIFNGATVFMSKSRKVLTHEYIDFDLVKEVYEMSIARDIALALWADDHLWATRNCKFVKAYRSLSDAELTIITDIEALRKQGISKIVWLDTPEVVARLQTEMNEHFGDKLNCHVSLPQVLEFVGPETSKAKALAEIGRLYGIDRSEMIAVGDGFNDISMIQYAGLGVAVDNAPAGVKNAADYITLSNNDEGEADVNEKFILINGKRETRGQSERNGTADFLMRWKINTPYTI